MAEDTDLEKLAKQYMDLWQKQLEGLAGDPDVAEMTARAVELMNAGPAAFAAMAGREAHGHHQDPGRDGGGDPDSGPEAAAPAPGDPDDELPRLKERVASLEERLARLEAGAAGGGGKPAEKSRGRRS